MKGTIIIKKEYIRKWRSQILGKSNMKVRRKV